MMTQKPKFLLDFFFISIFIDIKNQWINRFGGNRWCYCCCCCRAVAGGRWLAVNHDDAGAEQRLSGGRLRCRRRGQIVAGPALRQRHFPRVLHTHRRGYLPTSNSSLTSSFNQKSISLLNPDFFHVKLNNFDLKNQNFDRFLVQLLNFDIKLTLFV